MNALPTKMHPATLSEAMGRLDALFGARASYYGQVTAGASPAVYGALKSDGHIAKAFNALGDICMAIAPAGGDMVLPSALEAISDGFILHFGTRAFTRRPAPAATIALGLEATLEIYQRACLKGGARKPHSIRQYGETITAIGVDYADAMLTHLSLTGSLGTLVDLPYAKDPEVLNAAPPIDEETRLTLLERISPSHWGFQQAAE